MKRFCYRCGALEAKQGPLIQGLCQRCFVAENHLLHAPTEIEIVICKRCGSRLVGGRWQKPEGKGVSAHAVRESVLREIRILQLTDSGFKLVRPEQVSGLELGIELKLGREPLVEIRARGKMSEMQLEPETEDAKIKIAVRWTTCKVCALKRAGHHEAILQVRGGIPREGLAGLRRELVALAKKAGEQSPTMFIAKIEEHRGGLDFYVSSISLARRMAALMKEKFGAKISESAKLIGVERGGRRKFRVSLLARIP